MVCVVSNVQSSNGIDSKIETSSNLDAYEAAKQGALLLNLLSSADGKKLIDNEVNRASIFAIADKAASRVQ